jgi:hypothetical protein
MNLIDNQGTEVTTGCGIVKSVTHPMNITPLAPRPGVDSRVTSADTGLQVTASLPILRCSILKTILIHNLNPSKKYG